MLIGDGWADALSGETIDVINPADGARLTGIPAGASGDVDRAVAAARAAFDTRRWTSLAPGVRARILWRAADLIEANADEFAQLETLDNGKPIAMARAMDVPAAISALRYWSGWCTKLSGDAPLVDLPGEYVARVQHEPVGVAALIVPWNFPLAMAVAKLGPALAAGCSVILKPAEQTSLTALRLGEVLLEAGIPPGVVNIVTGYGATAGAALAHHPDVDKISFTGSTAVGKELLSAARGNLKRLTLELGGKSPVVVLSDADLDRVIPVAAGGIFRNAGQACAAGSRLFVERSKFDQVVRGIVEYASRLRIGPGLEPETTLGPLVSAAQQHRVLSYIESGRREGAEVLTGGSAHGSQGYFVQPTVIVDPGRQTCVMREEIFGPVLTAAPFDAIEDVIDYANATDYGLSANIWTRDVSNAYRIANRIRAGTVTINAGMITGPNLPFGGFKQSGWGREGGAQGLFAFTETKTIVASL
jgi:phenylacetaldehyde dehydrogenase